MGTDRWPAESATETEIESLHDEGKSNWSSNWNRYCNCRMWSGRRNRSRTRSRSRSGSGGNSRSRASSRRRCYSVCNRNAVGRNRVKEAVEAGVRVGMGVVLGFEVRVELRA